MAALLFTAFPFAFARRPGPPFRLGVIQSEARA